MKRRIWPILWFCIFLGGSAASFLYVQGFRFQSFSRELIPTGVLDISTYSPGALIFLNEDLRGTTPEVFRGIPLGPIRIRIEKSGFESFETTLDVQKDFVTSLSRFVLQPVNLSKITEVIGKASEVLWDPEKRGYIRLFPLQKIIEIMDLLAGTGKIIEFPEFPEAIEFTSDGRLRTRMPNQEETLQKVFAERFFRSFASLSAESFVSSDGSELVSFQGERLYLKDLRTKRTRMIWHAERRVLGAWWLSESDDILGVTDREIFLWNRKLQEKRTLMRKDHIGEAFFLPDRDLLVYKNNEIWESVNFGLL